MQKENEAVRCSVYTSQSCDSLHAVRVQMCFQGKAQQLLTMVLLYVLFDTSKCMFTIFFSSWFFQLNKNINFIFSLGGKQHSDAGAES